MRSRRLRRVVPDGLEARGLRERANPRPHLDTVCARPHTMWRPALLRLPGEFQSPFNERVGTNSRGTGRRTQRLLRAQVIACQLTISQLKVAVGENVNYSPSPSERHGI